MLKKIPERDTSNTAIVSVFQTGSLRYRNGSIKAFEDNSLPIQAVVIKTEKYMVKVLRGPLNKKVEFLARLRDFAKKTLKEQRRGVGNHFLKNSQLTYTKL